MVAVSGNGHHRHTVAIDGVDFTVYHHLHPNETERGVVVRYSLEERAIHVYKAEPAIVEASLKTALAAIQERLARSSRRPCS